VSLFHLLLILTVVIIWGVNFVAIKIALSAIPPILLCFARFLFCLPALFLVKRPPMPFIQIATYGLVMFVLQFCLLFVGMRSGITPGLASVLLQLQSFFAIAFAILFMKEKYHPRQGVGALVAFLGILLIAAHIGGDVKLSGVILVLSAATLWATGSVLAKRMKGSGLSLVAWGSLFACLFLLPLSFLIDGQEAIFEACQNLSWIHVGAVSYIAILSTLFGFGTWNWLLQRYPLSKVAPFTLLVPMVGILSSALFLGEELQWWKIVSALLIIGGVGVNVLAAPASAPAQEAEARETP
jgi:O-acetylserine/cysteine efflux transporter